MAVNKHLKKKSLATKALPCDRCGRIVENVDERTKRVICSVCVQLSVGFPEEAKSTYKPTGRPAGWHWMKEYVDSDGNVFHKGKEIPELKDTLPPTVIKPRKKIKRRSKEQILIDRHNKKKAVLKKAIKKQKDFLDHNFKKE
jgi:hypothetical protein